MNLHQCTQEERDHILMEALSEEKRQFLRKYAMHSTPEGKWVSAKNNTPARLYASQQYLLRNGMLEILFRKYQLCYAKLKYFRSALSGYECCKHTPMDGFVATPLWDAEFFRHGDSGKMVDLRYLQQITRVEDFYRLTAWLESK